MALRVNEIRVSNAVPVAGTALRVLRLSASTPASATPPDAGVGVVDIEPYSVIPLVGVGDSVGVWSQTAGVSVALSGSGASRSYVAPATVSGTVLRFSYSVAGQSAVVEHVVLPATELRVVGGVLQPVRWLRVVNGSLA